MPLLDDIMDHKVLGREFKRGMQQGQHDGELRMLLRQIEKRFGTVPPELRDRLTKMSVSEVEAMALRLLDAASLQDL